MAQPQRIVSKIEEPMVVDLRAEESILGSGDIELWIEFGLAHLLTFAEVAQQAALFDDLFDAEIQILATAHLLTGSETGAGQGWILGRISAHDVARRVGDHDLPAFDGIDAAEAQFRLGETVPALAGGETHDSREYAARG